MVQPVAESRVQTIDILRGFALFGIMFINIQTFRLPAQWTGVDYWVDQIILILAQSKFLTLFSILFGVSFVLQIERSGTASIVGRYVRRMIVLLVIGTAHYVLFWEGDILMFYVLPGLLLLFFARRRPRTILAVGGLLFVLFTSLTIVLTAASAETQTGGTKPEKSGDMQLPLAMYQNASYPELVAARLDLLPDRIPQIMFGSIVSVCLFLIGAYIGKIGILRRPLDHLLLLRRLSYWGVPVGILMNALVLLNLPTRNQLPALTQAALTGLTLPGILLLALGYLATVTLLNLRTRRLAFLAPVGRLSLTNYLMQTIILTTLFYGYGIGWFGQVSPTTGLLLIVIIFVFQIYFSRWWLKYFRYGPVEWLWRSITNWRVEPIRRSS